MLNIKNLNVAIKDKSILNGVNLKIGKGETHVIMGPNGSGKSTLAQTLFSHPAYKIIEGEIFFNSKNITGLATDKIAKLGMLLAFQYPQTIPGVTVVNLLKVASWQKPKKQKISLEKFTKDIQRQARKMHLADEFLSRSLNEGFSGGEKKKTEVLQLSVLKPKLAVFDETDSGLDIDALRIVAKQINELKKLGTSIMLITHYQRILKYIKPDFVHVLLRGRIVKSGSEELAEKIEKEGYEKIEM